MPNDEEVSTLGVEVMKNWEFPFSGNNDITFHASIWDFGGQDIQYMIHQYFLTGKSLYIMVADERKQNTHFEYWFNIIQLLGEGSPVLVVLNKRAGVAIIDYNHNEMCSAFPNLHIEQFELNLATDKEAFMKLRNKAQDLLCNLDHIGTELPAKWPKVREDLEKKIKQNRISLNEYLKICTKNEIKKEKDALYLADYLHALGTIIHYRDDETLRDFIILNPNWVVDALYTALSDKKIQQDSGHFSRDWIFDLWQNPGVDAKTVYNENECKHLLNLMNKEKFELCYELDKTNNFISPQLLSGSCPVKYNIDFTGSLDFRFRYTFMPEGIISRLIVRLDHLIHKQDDNQLVWRYGAIFAMDDCFAEVIQNQYSSKGDREISVRVTGNDFRKKELLTIINYEIESIHRKSFEHIHYDVLVPCNSEQCSKSENPKYFTLYELNKFVGYGDTETRCTECGIKVNIHKLVSGYGS